MANTTYRPGAPNLRGWMGAENPTFTVLADPVVTAPGSVTPTTLDDVDYGVDATASTESRFRCSASFIYSDEPTFSSSDAGVATVDANGVVSYVSDGEATIIAETDRGKVGATLEIVEETGGDQATNTFTSWVVGSLGEEIAGNIDTALSGTNPAVDDDQYSLIDNDTPAYTKNGSFWAGAYADNLTSVSIWDSVTLGTRAGVLITPRHVLFLPTRRYSPISQGTTIRFVNTTPEVFEYEILSAVESDGYLVCTLDADVDASIPPSSILPPGFAAQVPGIWLEGVPAIALDAGRAARVTDLASISGGDLHFRSPVASDRLDYFTHLTLEEYGFPIFFPIDGELVLATLATRGSAGRGVDIGQHETTLDELIILADVASEKISPGYTVTVADTSSYPTY